MRHCAGIPIQILQIQILQTNSTDKFYSFKKILSHEIFAAVHSAKVRAFTQPAHLRKTSHLPSISIRTSTRKRKWSFAMIKTAWIKTSCVYFKNP
jgi:hypothetical protein